MVAITSLCDLDAILDAEAPVRVTLPKIDSEVRERLRRRPALLFVESSACDAAGITQALQPYIEEAVALLVRTRELVIGDDLQQVLDDGLYNPRLGALFETLWVARFEHAEHRDNEASVRELLQATFTDPSPLLRNDVILFWLTLLAQNEAPPSQVLLLLTCPTPDPAFIRAAEHWAGLGSPVRVITGVS